MEIFGMTCLEVKNISKSYKVKGINTQVNKNISFSVEKGKLIWIYGNSGAGKSTLLNMLSGIDLADEGSITWDDINLNDMSEGQRAEFRIQNCGLIFQFFELIKAQNIYNNIAFPLKIKRKSKKEIDESIIPLCEYFEIEDLLQKMPENLSGGEKQRVSIVRSLSTAPSYIIADEITASLDVKNSHKVYSFLQKHIKKQNGVGIFVSHDPIIRDYVDCVYKMQEGCLIKA